jgi:hypothetical protein
MLRMTAELNDRSSSNQAIERTEFFGEGDCAHESGLTFWSLFRQTAFVEAEIDCTLPSNSS